MPALLQAEGYLSASVDSIVTHDNLTTVYLFMGQRYEWGVVHIRPEERGVLQQTGMIIREASVASAEVISGLPARIVDYYQNRGYPFVKVKWDSVQLKGNRIHAVLAVDKGPLYRLDSVGISGSLKISKQFLLQFLGISEGGVYNASVLENIDSRLSELPYLQQSQPWQITMQLTGFVINFYLQPGKSNQVNALLGLFPSSQQKNGRLLLAADVDLLLQNAFGSGERVDFSWQQTQPRSPRLQFIYRHPFVLRSAFGLNLGFQLYKKDSSFLNINGSAGLEYRLGTKQSATVMLGWQRTNLLEIDTNAIRISRRLPDAADMSVTSIGLGYTFNSTDYRNNPRKGVELTFSLSAGKKTIRRNNSITSLKDGGFDYRSLYDSVRMTSYQLRISFSGSDYFRLGTHSVLKAGIQSGLLQTPDYFRNEMFQAGGYRLMRGFDEESIFASAFAVTTVEYRYRVNQGSYFFVFTDLGYTSDRSRPSRAEHRYIGAGGGLAFEARAGLFNLAIAVGKRDDLRLNLRQTKLHIGYTSFF
ncbi:MAG TPA: BamA/TamA family outer membrane protein [Chitinophagaceae bacterium]